MWYQKKSAAEATPFIYQCFGLGSKTGVK